MSRVLRLIRDERKVAKARDAIARCYEAEPSPVHCRYGLTPQSEAFLLSAQDGRCGICERALHGLPRGDVVIDHDHSTGAVRGILCRRCNTTLGLLGDSMTSVQAATARIQVYLAAAAKTPDILSAADLVFGRPRSTGRRWTQRIAGDLWDELRPTIYRWDAINLIADA